MTIWQLLIGVAAALVVIVGVIHFTDLPRRRELPEVSGVEDRLAAIEDYLRQSERS
jgi:hypothetical protein